MSQQISMTASSWLVKTGLPSKGTNFLAHLEQGIHSMSWRATTDFRNFITITVIIHNPAKLILKILVNTYPVPTRRLFSSLWPFCMHKGIDWWKIFGIFLWFFLWSHADRGLTCLLFLYIFYDGFSLSQWTGTLDWTTGLTYFWFLHMLWLAKLILVGREPFKHDQQNQLRVSAKDCVISYRALIHSFHFPCCTKYSKCFTRQVKDCKFLGRKLRIICV